MIRRSFFHSGFTICLAVVAFIMCGTFNQVNAAGFMVSPGRVELTIKPGAERTFALTVDYSRDAADKDLTNLRIAVRSEDWILKSDGSMSTGPGGTLPRSGTSWVTVSTSEFTIAPGTKELVRVTISVPAGTAPGDYYAAVFAEDRNPPPPPKEGQRQLNVRYRFYSLIYVVVPELTTNGELQKLDAAYDGKEVKITSLLRNTGNSHIRPKHSFEVRDQSDHVVAKSEQKDTTVLLGNNELQQELTAAATLPPGIYKVVYEVDFGQKQAIQAGQIVLRVPAAEAPPTTAKQQP